MPSPGRAPRGLGARRLWMAGAVVVLAAVLAVTPGLRSPVSRLANYDADSADPIYDIAVDGDALRRAGSILPDRDGISYFVYSPAASGLLIGNIRAAMALYALPALPVQRAESSDWILSYDSPGLVPPGQRPQRVHQLSPRVALVEIAR